MPEKVKHSQYNTQTGGYFCTKCNASYYPDGEELRSKSKLVIPTGNNSADRGITVSYLKDPNDFFNIGKVNPKGNFCRDPKV